ncbi:hypothetical protein [Parapedomonas caeni]
MTTRSARITVSSSRMRAVQTGPRDGRRRHMVRQASVLECVRP